LHRTGEQKPKSETSAVSNTERPGATTKALLRERERKHKKSSKLWNLKRETGENSVLLN
jgi:hypothetical protein